VGEVLRAISVCCGAGGWAVAARGLPIRVIAAFDLMEDCLVTYCENHPGVQAVRCDINEVDWERWAGKVDLVLGGIPCEDLSVARNNVPVPAGNLEKLYKLIDLCLEIPRVVGARWWVYEDVMQIVKCLPPMTPYFVLDSQYFSPQRRRRAYIGNVPMPKALGDSRLLDWAIQPGPYRKSLRISGRTPGRSSIYNSKQFYPWTFGEKSPTVINLCSRHDNYAAVVDGNLVRQLEWQELARLQGFPKDYVFCGTPTRVGKMVAQAVQVDTGKAILKALVKSEG